jgi:hypothetical protein
VSRGPGQGPRAILDELQRHEVCFLGEVLRATQTRAEQLAAVRGPIASEQPLYGDQGVLIAPGVHGRIPTSNGSSGVSTATAWTT